jgi:chemotaxis signal transduction protein
MISRNITCVDSDSTKSELDFFQGGYITTFGTHKKGNHIQLEICGCIQIEALKNAPPSIRGAIRFNGKVIPVYDPHIAKGQEPHLITKDTCILLGTRTFGKRNLKVGRLCDDVTQVLELTMNTEHSFAS